MTPPREPLYALAVEGAELRAACMREMGFAAEVVNGSGVFVRHGEEQQDAVDDALRVCGDRYSDYEINYRPTLRESYEWEAYLAGCLRAQGYDIPEIPTFDAWADGYETDPWLAYDKLGDAVPQDRLVELYGLCPPF